jgi:hypothetical protein
LLDVYNRSRARCSMHMKEYRTESSPLFDIYGSRCVSKPTRQDRLVRDIANKWSRIVGTPSERIEDRSKDDLVQTNYKIIVFVYIAY